MSLSDQDSEHSLAETIRELVNQPVGTSRLSRWRRKALELAEHHTTRGPFAEVAVVGWGVNRRIQRVGGNALAALVAYRIFVWLLPFALVSVFIVGLFHDEPIDVSRATDRFGIAGYVGASISQATAAAGGPNLLSGAIIGGLVLLYQTYALVRGLRAVHALIWQTRLTRVRSPLVVSLVSLAAGVALVLSRGLLDGAGRAVGGLVAVVLVLASYFVGPAVFILLTRWMPNRAAGWRDLIPGAVVLTVAGTVIHAGVAYVLLPYLDQKAETYGGLGLAAGLMLALYALGWAVAMAAALNAELVDRRARSAGT